jgi:RecQ family ATP-dependent DNA helicase
MNADLGNLSAEEIQTIQELRRKRQLQLAVTKARFAEVAVPTIEEVASIALQFDRHITGLRPGQYECIADLLQQKDVVAIIPTGGGKSLIWLIPAIIIQRVQSGQFNPLPLVVVIVPFIATMESHLANFVNWGLAASSNESLEILRTKITNCRWIYCTPEKLVRNEMFRKLIVGHSYRIRYVVYDEAHEYLAAWREDLLKCPGLVSELLPNATIFACTATCSTEDMPRLLPQLQLCHQPAVHRLSVDRSNCFLRVVASKDEKSDIAFMFDRIKVVPASLIFVTTKKQTEEIASGLRELADAQLGDSSNISGDQIVHFHSELSADVKKKIISDFLAGRIRCVVATQAFGTGINLPSVRVIIHRSLCAKVSLYLQNIGRGGRDGNPYECILMFSYQMIYDCGKIWMSASRNETELASEWKQFAQMISYPMSSKCRRAHLLPLFDDSFDSDSVCDRCDNCIARLGGLEDFVDVTKACRMMLQVITECATQSHPAVSMSRIRDIMLGWQPRNVQFDDDKLQPKFGCAREAGYKQNPQLWMLLSSYLLYAVAPPLLSETVTSTGDNVITRLVTITLAGRAFLANDSEFLRIRYPIEFREMQHDEVDLLFNPVIQISSKKCSYPGCQKSLHSKLFCHTHYMQERRKNISACGASAASKDASTGTATSVLSSHDPRLLCTTPSSAGTATSSLSSPDPISHCTTSSSAVLGKPIEKLDDESSDGCMSSSSSESSDDERFQTFSVESIDPVITKELMQHQFYPGGVHPAATEVHVLPSGSRADNIGWALKSHRTRTEFATGSNIRTVACAGCLVCPVSSCPYKARPNSKGVSQKSCGNVAMHGRNPPQLILQECSAKFVYSTDISTGIVTLTATCHSSHDRPPPKGPSPATLAMIQQRMAVTGQKPSSYQMLKDSAAVSQDPGAQDASQLQRHINAVFKTMYGADLGMSGLQNLSKILSVPFVREAQLAFGESPDTNFDFIYCQLEEQVALTANVADAYNQSPSAKTSCILYADVTYQFSTMYKMAIMTQSRESGKGVTLAIILVTRLHALAYKRIFLAFFIQNPSLWSVAGGTLQLLFEACLVDFSDSQRSGFLQAVEALWRQKFSGDFTAALRQSFAAKLKGCYFHLCQSIKSVSHNSHVVPNGLQDEFKRLAHAMYTATTMSQFNDAVSGISQRFPRANKWLTWWTAPSHAGLIFPAFRASELGGDLMRFYNMPTTNNISESHNRKVNRFIAYKEMPPVVAVHDAFKYCEMEVRELSAIRSGHAKVHKRERAKQTVIQSRLDEYPGGRAPQTNRELLGSDGKRLTPLQVASTGLPQSSMNPASAGNDATVLELRSEIAREGLRNGTIVQCKNKTSDKWCVLFFIVIIFLRGF